MKRSSKVQISLGKEWEKDMETSINRRNQFNRKNVKLKLVASYHKPSQIGSETRHKQTQTKNLR